MGFAVGCAKNEPDAAAKPGTVSFPGKKPTQEEMDRAPPKIGKPTSGMPSASAPKDVKKP